MSNDFMSAMKKTLNDEYNVAFTENGAAGYRTTGKSLLDLNFAVASLRKATPGDIAARFTRAFFEDQVAAMKWLFFARDIRGGLGERRLFRVVFQYMAKSDPNYIKPLIKLVPEYGRWDDLWCLFGTDLESDLLDVVCAQLKEDISNMNSGKSISLLAKWIPSINASSPVSRRYAKLICGYIGIQEWDYRKAVSALRTKLDIVEKKMSTKAWGDIVYEAVPSRANLLYNSAFLRHDEDRRRKFLSSLEKGETKINASTLFPHDIVSKYTNGGWSVSVKGLDQTLEALWKSLPDTVNGCGNTIVVADGSGSMTTSVSGKVSALDVANALAIYFAERSSGQFKDKYITFSERPQLVDLSRGKSLRDKIKIALSHDEVANTNIEAVFDLILDTAIENHKLFGLNKIFLTIKKQWGLRTAKQWLEQEFSKGFYLNDSTTASYFPYCWANDLTRLATEGLFFLDHYNHQAPKHLTTYFDDVIEFVSFLSNRQSGAVGLPNVLIWAWYFWKKDVDGGYYMKNPSYYARQQFQKFIYRLNQPFLRIDQSAFTNVSIFDRPYLESLFGGVEFPDGQLAIDHIEDFIEFQKVFMEVVSEIREENMFTYPVLTYSLYYKDGKFQDEEFARWCSNHNIKWSDSNFFVSDNIGILSNCCRLLSDTKKLDAFINSIGGTALSVGSCRVSTINLVRIAYESKLNKKKYLDILRDRVLLDCKALYSMRHVIKRNIEKGLLPNYQDGAVELDKQFCTIGGIGMYEVMDLFSLIDEDEMGNKSYSDEAVEFATEILDTINEVKDNFECDFTFNLEMIPAENCAGVICAADNLLFEQNKYFIYSNQWIPLMEKCTIQEKCRLGSLFDKKCGGGCIAHIDIESRFPNEEAAWDMLNYVASQGVIYFAFTTKISVCADKHAFMGTKTCPTCGKPIADTYARVVGFYTPVSSYQAIRKQEFNQRKWYDVLTKSEVM